MSATDAALWPCSLEEYHADAPRSVSHTELDVFISSPELYYGRYISRKWPQEPKRAFEFGNVFHWVALGEPFAVTGDNVQRRTVGLFRRDPVGPEGVPDYVSPSGSRYWHRSSGLYREADHWGVVGRNYWPLDGGHDGAERVTGFCPWDRFLFQEHFVPVPDEVLTANGQRRGKRWEEFVAEHDGQVLLKAQGTRAEPGFDALAQMLQSIREHPKAAEFLGMEGDTEVSLRWTDAETGLVLRCRPDKIGTVPGKGDVWLLADLKSTQSIHPQAFSREALLRGYARQAAFYQDGIEALTGDRVPFVFVAVEKGPPFGCAVYELAEQFVDLGRDQNRRALRQLAQALATDNFRSPTHGLIVELDAPAWAYRESEWQFLQEA